MNKQLLIGILSVTGAWLIDLAFGYIYTSDIRSTYAIWVSAVALAIQGFTMPLGGFLEKKVGFRIVVAISCLLQSGGVLLSFFTIKHSFATLLVTYCLLLGGGTGLGYAVVLALATAWFPKHRGLVVGIIVAGFGLGAFMFTPIQTILINPDNVEVNNETRQFTDERVLNRIPNALLILGGTLLSIETIGFLLLRARPTDDDTTLDTKVAEDFDSLQLKEKLVAGVLTKQGLSVESNEINLPPLAVLKCVDFYLLWLIMFFCIIPITIINSVLKLYGQQYISNDRFLSIVATFAAIFNSGGRIFWGALVDRISFKVPMCIMFSVWSLVLISFPHLHLIGGTGLLVTYAIWVFLLFFSFSGVFALMPAAVGSVFGHKNLAINYGMIFSAFAVGGTLCALMVSMLHSKDNYLMQFTGCGITNIIGTFTYLDITWTALFTLLWVEDRKIPARFRFLNKLSSYCRSCRHQRSTELTQLEEIRKCSKA